MGITARGETSRSKASRGFERVSRRVVEAGVGKDGQRAHGGEDDEDPEEHAVHHHGHVLPVLSQLHRRVIRWRDGEDGGDRQKTTYYSYKHLFKYYAKTEVQLTAS